VVGCNLQSLEAPAYRSNHSDRPYWAPCRFVKDSNVRPTIFVRIDTPVRIVVKASGMLLCSTAPQVVTFISRVAKIIVANQWQSPGC
jgi:hypothetical protein